MQTQTIQQQEQASRQRAAALAMDQAAAGNLPTLTGQSIEPDATRQTWAVGSRSQPDLAYTVELTADCDGIATRCDCLAGRNQRLCWHRLAARLAVYGDIAWRDGRRPPHPTPLRLVRRAS